MSSMKLSHLMRVILLDNFQSLLATVILLSPGLSLFASSAGVLEGKPFFSF